MDDKKFDDIRPYRDYEIPAAMARIASDPHLVPITEFTMPGMAVKDMADLLLSVKTIEEFQGKIMFPVTDKIISKTTDGFDYKGLEYIGAEKGWLFISNHRDIVTDSLLLQRILFTNDLPTTEITFGSNLMSSQLVIDIGKANKMFKVERKGTNLREFLSHSAHLSDYIRQTINAGRSVWIAQRNGRTKDGNDVTDQGLVKMLSMSGGRDKAASFAELNIAPVVISYQWEPCDIAKTREIYLSRDGKKYVKRPDEDFQSILSGIINPKGEIHIEITKPVSPDEISALQQSDIDFFRGLADLIDSRVHNGYKLFDTNYLAHDLRSGKRDYNDKYDSAVEKLFLARMEKLRETVEGDWGILKDIFLGIYANPVDNAMKATKL